MMKGNVGVGGVASGSSVPIGLNPNNPNALLAQQQNQNQMTAAGVPNPIQNMQRQQQQQQEQQHQTMAGKFQRCIALHDFHNYNSSMFN